MNQSPRDSGPRCYDILSIQVSKSAQIGEPSVPANHSDLCHSQRSCNQASRYKPCPCLCLLERSALVEVGPKVFRDEDIVVEPDRDDASVQVARRVLQIGTNSVVVATLNEQLDVAVNADLGVVGVEAVPSVRSVLDLHILGRRLSQLTHSRCHQSTSTSTQCRLHRQRQRALPPCYCS